MALELVGIGDLHLDGKLLKYLPDLNARIVHEVRRVLEYATRNGVQLIVFYGDICETPNMSMEAHILFFRLLAENTKFKFLIILGNHDRENSETHSLQFFMELCQSGALPHVRIFDKPATLFRKSGTPLRLLPWPSLDTDPDCLNVIHEAVAGAHWDHGRAVDGAKKVKDICVAGHIHTAQKIGQAHFSGTLYQTSFGEKPNKYFHHVVWEDDKIPLIHKIKHKPRFTLVNAVVRSAEDLAELSNDPSILYKVFVKDSAVLDDSAFAHLPNVVKHNFFKTKAELEMLMVEELKLDDEFDAASVLSVEDNLKGWLESASVEDDLKRAAYRKFKTLFG